VTSASAVFGGNPNVTITAISTAGGIARSRSAGQLPAFVHVSAKNITATTTSQPYEDLEYGWDFGDPSGTETFTNPSIYPYSTGGPSVNANTDQTGPEAVYVYRTAGTYTITLTCRGANGAGFTTATVTTTFTANTFNATGLELWVDSVGGSDSNNGLSIGAPIQTLGKAFTLTSAIGTPFHNVAWHLARGSNFLNGAAGIGNGNTLPVNGFRVDAYGVGADPIREDNVNNYGAIQFSTGSGGSTGGVDLQDIVISNVQAKVGSGNTGQIVCGLVGQNDDPALVVSDFYFDNVTATTTVDVQNDIMALSTNSGFNMGNAVRNGFWNCSSTCPLTGGVNNRMGIYCGTHQWLFIVGGTIIGQGTGGAQDHHIYPVVQENFLCRWINFGSSIVGGTPTRSYCINGDWVNLTSAYSEYSNGLNNKAHIAAGVLTIDQIGNASPPMLVGMILYDASSNSIPNGVTITNQISGTTGGNGTYAISNNSFSIVNFTVIGVVSTDIAQWWCVDSNYCFGTQYVLDMDDGFNNALAVQWENTVSQKNAINGLTLGAFFFSSCLTGTFRDSLAWGIQGAGFIQPSISNGNVAASMAANCRYQAYRNKVYQSDGATFSIGGGQTLTATKPIVFTDNQIEDTRSGSTCDVMELVSAQNTTSILDRNNYLCPNATNGGTAASQFNKDSGSVLTFTAWQALGANFDPNSTATTAAFPTWINPSIGHFT
jgi:hypothetical protein